jgi:choline dehydrogenase
VEVWTGDERLVAHASEEVLLSAAPSTRRSCCSCRASARRCCSSTALTLCDLPGVGANLQDHLQIRAVYKVQGAHAQHHGQLPGGQGQDRAGIRSSAAAR